MSLYRFLSEEELIYAIKETSEAFNTNTRRGNTTLYKSLARQISVFRKKYPNSNFKVYLLSDNKTTRVLVIYLPFF